ncbi:hypothetical protein E8E11_003962 [Didymella keratinophila]|nr:hypothetical protein E8E11_003962 [Didymella keratinophila]
MPHRTPRLFAKPIANGKSVPARIDALSFLTLPAEIRNSINKYLLVHEEAIHVVIMELKPHPLPQGQTRISTSPCRTIESGLISSYRQIDKEAATFFYFNNTFHLNSGIHLRTMPCWHTVFSSFCEKLGSQAQLLRKIVIDKQCPRACLKPELNPSLGEHSERRRDLESLDVILKTIWNLNVTADISFVTPPLHPLYQEDLFNGPVLSRIIKFFAEGASDDHSHGAMVWHTSDTLRGELQLKEVPGIGTSYLRFSVDQAGEVLRPIDFPTKSGLFTLPEHLRNRLFDDILHPGIVDHDEPSPHPFGLAYINRITVSNCVGSLLSRSKLVLSISTTQLRSGFSGFNHLRRLMHTTIGACRGGIYPGFTLTVTEQCIKAIKVILNFELQEDARLKDLRISTLPLILELAHVFSFSRVISRIRAPVNGTRKLVAELLNGL